MVAKLIGTVNNTNISIPIPRNQMFVVFQTNKEIVGKGFYALIFESKYFGHVMRHCIFSLNMLISIS